MWHSHPLHGCPLPLHSPSRRHPDALAHGGAQKRTRGGEGFCSRATVCHFSPLWLHSQVVASFWALLYFCCCLQSNHLWQSGRLHLPPLERDLQWCRWAVPALWPWHVPPQVCWHWRCHQGLVDREKANISCGFQRLWLFLSLFWPGGWWERRRRGRASWPPER